LAIAPSAAAHVHAQMLWRKPIADGRASGAADAAILAVASAPARAVTKAPPSLVFRKSLPTNAASAAPDAPAVTHAPTTTIARKVDSSTTAHAKEHAHAQGRAPAAAAHNPPIDLDWMTREVSIRLARQLEIERDRLGVRTWRR
jgi:hypothetical protein